MIQHLGKAQEALCTSPHPCCTKSISSQRAQVSGLLARKRYFKYSSSQDRLFMVLNWMVTGERLVDLSKMLKQGLTSISRNQRRMVMLSVLLYSLTFYGRLRTVVKPQRGEHCIPLRSEEWWGLSGAIRLLSSVPTTW